MKKIFTLLTVLGLSVIGLKAQVWSGTTSSDWSVATNWLGGVVPTESGTVQIPATGVANPPILSANTKIGNLTLDAGTVLDLNGKTLTVVGKISGTGQLRGSATSGIYAGGPGALIITDPAQNLAQFNATPVSYFENFDLLGNPDLPYTSIEFGNADFSFDIRATTSFAFPTIQTVTGFPGRVGASAITPAETDLTTIPGVASPVDLIFEMIGTQNVTAFSATFLFTDLAFNLVTRQESFDLRIKFADGSPDVVSRHSTGAPVGTPGFVGFISNRPISQVIFEPLGAATFITVTDVRIGKKADFGSINLNQTGTSNTLGSLTVDVLSTEVVTLASSVNIATSVAPLSGTLQSNGNLKLLSSETGTAMVASHTEAGTITGNVIVERFIPSGRKNQWRFLGFPYSGPLSLSNISGTAFDFNIPNTNAPSTIKYFDPVSDNGYYGTGNSLGNAGYKAITDINGQISSGQGVATWLYGTSGTASQGILAAPMTITSTGILNESGLVFTKSLITNVQGWNLIANPFASTIDWKSIGINKANVDPTLYRWDPEAVNWTTYNHLTDAITGNGSRYIESGTSFFVKNSTRSATPVPITFDQSSKVTNAGSTAHLSRNGKKLDIASQRIEAASSSQMSGLRVKASGTGNPIPADIYLDLSKSDATSAYDNKYDAIAMGRSSGADVKFVGEKDALAVQFDAPIKTPGAEKRYYPLMVTMPQAGNGQIDLSVEGSWNTLNTVSLIDTKDNKTIPMVGGKLSYAFKMQDLKEDGRFILAINHVAAKGADNGNEVTVRVLNNPVRSETIQALISHPKAKAKNWSVLSASGSAMSTGQINPSDASVQHELKAGKLNSNGVYYLKVNFENGDSKTVRFVKL